MTAIQEIVPKPEHEELDRNSVEGSCETTKELFRRDDIPHDEVPIPATPKTPPLSPKCTKTPTITKKGEATKKRSNSGIPLRLKSGTNTTARNPTRPSTYRHHPSTGNSLGPVINKNTLEVQFINNKKRLMQLHAELLEKQRPLVDMHKSLLRTKKQLEALGKHVVLDDIKVMSLMKTEDRMDGAGETPVAETAMTLKSSIDNVLDQCVKVCKKCFVKRDSVVKVLENMTQSLSDPSVLESELEELKREKGDLEKSIETIIKENSKKMENLIGDWQKSVKSKSMTGDVISKISHLEDTVKQQQKAISEAEDNLHNISRKFEDKKATYEKTIGELHDKINRLEDELKKERKNSNDNLMKTRNLRTKVTELETRTKEAEEKSIESSKKLGQLQEQLRKKEIQWLKEKDDFKKNEALLQQKYSERQSQFDTRLKDMEKLQKNTEKQQENNYRTYETQLEINQQELARLGQEKEILAQKSGILEDRMEEMKKLLEEKNKEIHKLNAKAESVLAIEYSPQETDWAEILEYKQKITDVQNTLQKQTEQIGKMQGSLKAHAQLAAALKLEKDNALKYSMKLREILQEARDEIEYKNKTIYKIHEKLVLKEKACDKLKAELKNLEDLDSSMGDRWNKNRCQICMSSVGGDKGTECSTCADAEVGKFSGSTPQYVSESLIGMSVKKVDHLRARLDNLKKMKLPGYHGKKYNSWSSESCQSDRSVNKNLKKQIELRGKLYEILQNHADQSCEDFINLLKLSVSSNGPKGVEDLDELNPSNFGDNNVDTPFGLRGFSSNFEITESFSQFRSGVPFDKLYNKINKTLLFDKNAPF